MTEAQRDDPELAAIIGALTYSTASPDFVLRNGTLYRRVWFKNSNAERRLTAIPASLRQEILHAVHDSPEGGHIGQRATLQKVQERFWWPKMHSQIRAYVASCEVCQQYKRITGSRPCLLTPIPTPETAFHTIGIDHVGPLPTTAGGNRYIIVALDYLSKYVEVAARTLYSCQPRYRLPGITVRMETRNA